MVKVSSNLKIVLKCQAIKIAETRVKLLWGDDEKINDEN